MTADPVARPEADAETTTVRHPLEAPLPPYAQAGGSYPSVPMSPSAPPPPPSYPPAAQPPSVADAMVEISMPPLAPAVADGTPAPAEVSLDKSAPVGAAPVQAAEAVVVQPSQPPRPAAELVPLDEPLPEPVTQLLPPAAQPSTTAAAMPPPATETITCPECGTIAHVTVNRRESMDFCRNCDFPLFWTPSAVIRDPSGTTDESLRRLPGQAGRATIASLACPFCYEPNALSAQTCIRCHRPMHPVDEPPPPAPVYVPPPAPVVVEQPRKVAWWVWALLALGAAALIVLVVLIATGTIG